MPEGERSMAYVGGSPWGLGESWACQWVGSGDVEKKREMSRVTPQSGLQSWMDDGAANMSDLGTQGDRQCGGHLCKAKRASGAGT